MVSNTPLEFVFDQQAHTDTLAFQVDLWSARGAVPHTLADVLVRQKDIQYSSRTRRGTDAIRERQHERCLVAQLLAKLPPELQADPIAQTLRGWSNSSVYDVVHLIYQSKSYEAQCKDYEFGEMSMREHWNAGLADIRHTLKRHEYFDRPSPELGIATHDIHREQPGT